MEPPLELGSGAVLVERLDLRNVGGGGPVRRWPHRPRSKTGPVICVDFRPHLPAYTPCICIIRMAIKHHQVQVPLFYPTHLRHSGIDDPSP